MKPLEESEFEADVSQLLVAVVLGEATDAQICRLNELLLRDESLRHHAARFLEEEVVLRREFEVFDRVVGFHNPLSKDGGKEYLLSNNAIAICETRFQRIRRQILYLASAVMIAAVIGTIWLGRWAVPSNVGHLADEADLQQRPLAASMLSPVTYVSWAGPRFAAELNAEPLSSSMQEGVVSFTSAFGRPAQGYMVRLQPNSFLDLIVAADADGENALAVIEFDRVGRPTGRRLSFSNSAGEDKLARDGSGRILALTKKGRLGIWTERNDSAGPRFYLFTAVHKLLNRSVDDSWHVSRLLPFVERPDLFHIGWDDSGMLSTGDQDRIHIPDDDFDDVSATIRIRKSNSEPSGRAPGVHVYSNTVAGEAESNQTAADESNGYPFSVAPGHVAIVKVCSRSGAPVEIAVLEKETATPQWRCRKEGSHSPTLGICAIENNTPEVRKFVLTGQIKRPNAGAQASSGRLNHSVLFEKEELVTVGFDDGKETSDYDRVKVDILTMGDL